MDIDSAAFSQEAIKILNEVADSHFIAFDLEFSGLPPRRPTGKTKLTAQEYYDDTKAAVEKYQILQVGFTIVKQDLKRGRYVARPYNFNLSPLTSLREHLFSREWSYTSGSVAFLLKHRFHFDPLFTSGVRYLSRTEEQLARQNIAAEEEAKSKLPDMDLHPEDDTLLNHIRTSVRTWQSEPKDQQEDYLNIPLENAPGIPQPISRYQHRLIHQTIRNEYPNLKTTGMGHFVRVTNPTQSQQASQNLALVDIREKSIAEAVGFRWLIEGMIGGNILTMPDDYIVAALPAIRNAGQSPKQYLETLQQKLKARPRILIGHNCFTDFLYLYKCFIGPLPTTIEQFASQIHDLFPGIIDTKSLASFGHKRYGRTSLEDTEKEMANEEKPKIYIPSEYSRYTGTTRPHEAGYDSLLTAKVAIKLSAKLEREREYLEKETESAIAEEESSFGDDLDKFYDIKPDDGDTMKQVAEDDIHVGGPVLPLQNRRQISPSVTKNPIISKHGAVDEPATLEVSGNQARPELVAVKESVSIQAQPTEMDDIKKALARTNIYEVLESEAAGPESGAFGDGTDTSETQPELYHANMQKPGEMMPLWSNKVFWNAFGNKLQLNGSKEGLLKVE